MKGFLPFRLLWGTLAAILAGTSILSGRAKPTKEYLVYVGTYTGRGSRGIYAYRFDAASGRVTPLGLAAESTNPTFLAVAPSGRFLYAVNEVSNFQGTKSGGVSAFAIDHRTGMLTFLNEVASRGTGPCYISLEQTGKYVLVANYGSGDVATFPVLADGRLGEASAVVQHQGHGMNPERQEGPHAHCFRASPDNRYALAADLGLDQIVVDRFDASNGSLTPNDPAFGKVPAGSGVRHFDFSPDGKFVYAVNEMGSSITEFSYDASRGALQALRTISTLPTDFKGQNDGAEIIVSRSGKFLYASNRGYDTIAVFAIHGDGLLTPEEQVPTQGKTPRGFEIDPTGTYLFAANQDSASFVVFRIDPQTGHLTPTGQTLHLQSPVTIAFAAVH